MVIIAITSNLSIGAMFLGGILPGLLIAISLILACWIYAKRGGPAYRDAMPFSWTRLVQALFDALPALTIPFIIVGGIAVGAFTATEAACVAVEIGRERVCTPATTAHFLCCLLLEKKTYTIHHSTIFTH